MPAIQLTPAERAAQRADAHALRPVVMIGGDGLTPAVLKEADAALKAHGLIKIRVFSDDREERNALLASLADQLDAAPVQHIGKLLVLWRPLPEKEKAPATLNAGRGTRTIRVVKPAKTPTHRPQVQKLQVLGNQRVTAGGMVKRSKVRQQSVKKRAG
jgi:putative YhbY family RNA-binding protein